MDRSFNARYTHTNLVARDWKRLAAFYEHVFGCVPVPPERDISGEWLSRVTGVPDAALCGVHLRLPGHGDSGPTLEIFQYSRVLDAPTPAANRQGYGHVAFAVDDERGRGGVAYVLHRALVAARLGPIPEVAREVIIGQVDEVARAAH